ncbi:hypothetical protein IQ266_06040 [filamentous cyanobacterium LEGE 11480]|uniref:DUF304 domain-containing protein n=1 Tax=Romeriopsis navalis LEGE 11480 TaxID=2777977 RepID=A0A928VKI0_9CYAN|nr:hypothetical protein [Romeriopsis navalis]MBE9029322.1 hypothetical protein [Romeriopsis navalis LEGE 11480]
MQQTMTGFDEWHLSADLRRRIEQELQPGEPIAWLGQPIPRWMTLDSIIFVLFAIPWTTFALFWMWAAFGMQMPDLANGIKPNYIIALFGIPFVLIGLFMLSSPIWKRRTLRRTVYLVTDRRAIIIRGGFYITIRSYAPEQLQDVYRRERRSDIGDVIIAQRQIRNSNNSYRTELIGFLGIADAHGAEQRIKRLAAKA